MPSETPNLKLPLYTESDGQMTFKSFWESICYDESGEESGNIKSAFQKIDASVGNKQDKIDSLTNTEIDEIFNSI